MNKKKDTNIAREILRLRLSQMIINEKYKAGAFKVPMHIAMGHEAIAVAVDAVMEKDDLFAGSHRNMHYNLARAKALKPVLDEYLLKKEGLAHAELGSMNLANPEKNIVYTSSILGNNLPVAAGLALGHKAKGVNGVVVVQTGDGAMEEGAFYESLLFAKSNSLALIILVENNEWSMHTKIPERRSEINVAEFAGSIGAGYKRLGGNNAYQYIEELKSAKNEVLKKKTPMVLEIAVTTLGGWYVDDGKGGQRFIHPHSGPLPKTELAEWPELEHSPCDPVFVLQEYFSSEELKTMAREILKALKAEIGEV